MNRERNELVANLICIRARPRDAVSRSAKGAWPPLDSRLFKGGKGWGVKSAQTSGFLPQKQSDSRRRVCAQPKPLVLLCLGSLRDIERRTFENKCQAVRNFPHGLILETQYGSK